MANKLTLTPKIAALITSATDGGTDPNTVSVFETVSLNSLPVKKNGGIFKGAVHPENTLRQMAEAVATHPLANHVPMHTLHQQGYELPIGQVFHGEYLPGTNGMGEVRSLFFLPNTEVDLISKLDSGTINEVSVGVRYHHINCSQCGWDYMGADATMMNFYDTVCANDHTIGVDGVHVVCNGLDRWMEQSLVSLGAAQGAKIIPRTKSLLGNDSYNSLAASGIDPSATTLYATATLPKEKSIMEMPELIASLTDAKATVIVRDAALVTLTAAAETSKASIATLESTVATLTAENTALKAGDAVALKAERDAAFAFVREEADRLSIAAGSEKVKPEGTMDELKASITLNRTKLSATIPVGGRSEEATAGSGTSASERAVSSHAASFTSK